MAVAEYTALFPPDADEAAALLESALGIGVVAEEKLFDVGVGGTPEVLAARRDGRLVGVAVTSGRYLRLLVVDPSARGIGVGSGLLDRALAEMKKAGNDVVRLAAEPGNYLAPGLDTNDERTIHWFERRGFEATETNVNLVVDVANNDRVSTERLDALIERSRQRGYEVSRADKACAAEVTAFAKSMLHAWGIEVARALSGPPGAVHIARDANGELAAFAAHDGNNRGLGWFGPAATLEAHRGKGLGEACLVACLVDVAAAGHAQCNIAWIGPREFYRRSVGIARERTFVAMEKTL